LKILKNVLFTLFFILGALLLIKSYQIFNVVPDGDGIGIGFLGMEINDRVPNSQIDHYAWQFLKWGVAMIIVSLLMQVIPKLKFLKRT
jgi:hypothetical protein